MTTYILGLNAWHGDASAALFAGGELIAAAEEERFTRVKHWAGFPELAIRYCLAEAGIGLDAVAHVAMNSDPGAHFWRKLRYAMTRRPSLSLIRQRLGARRQRTTIAGELSRRFSATPFTGQIHSIEHHLAHLASSFLMSPFPRAAVVSVDGFGDFSSAAWGLGEGFSLSVDEQVFFPHSLGLYYEALTQYLGFPRYGDEYKVMGLAAYGRPLFTQALKSLVRGKSGGGFELALKYFRHHRERIEFRWDECEPSVGRLFTQALEDLLGPARQTDAPLEQRHKDIAASMQAVYEEQLFNLLDVVYGRYGGDALCLAGGCAMNSVANGKVPQRTAFKRVYVQSAAGDAGGAIGAAAVTVAELRRERPAPMIHSSWGPRYTAGQIRTVIDQHKDAIEATSSLEWIADEKSLCQRVAGRIAQGDVIGWFQGRMEWGARALGNRSILGDPRRADMKDILNLKIKRRESFRPFAPSILREQVNQWFEQEGDVPFMTQVFEIRAGKRAQIPAVTHVDGTGRLQTVTEAQNARYYRLIQSFAAITGVPMVLNTSFNENEPIVCRPEEALDCYLRTKMDVLVLGDCLIERKA